jgi:hypothetical protein
MVKLPFQPVIASEKSPFSGETLSHEFFPFFTDVKIIDKCRPDRNPGLFGMQRLGQVWVIS